MSGFTREEFVSLEHLLTTTKDVRAALTNNVGMIVEAVRYTAATFAPHIAEPDGDGDRTVHPAIEEAPNLYHPVNQYSPTVHPAKTGAVVFSAQNEHAALLRRVTELEKLANATAMFALSTSQTSRSRELLDQARNAWLKTRAGEWV